jgi:hypothetical protein
MRLHVWFLPLSLLSTHISIKDAVAAVVVVDQRVSSSKLLLIPQLASLSGLLDGGQHVVRRGCSSDYHLLQVGIGIHVLDPCPESMS